MPDHQTDGFSAGQLAEASGRFTAAHGYLHAIEIILTDTSARSESDLVWTTLPLNLLAGFVLELHFKAWLLIMGITSRRVRAFGHDIHRLDAEAAANGLPDIPGLIQVVEALGPGHADLSHRYVKPGGEVMLMEWSRTLPILQSLDSLVEDKVAMVGRFAIERNDGTMTSIDFGRICSGK